MDAVHHIIPRRVEDLLAQRSTEEPVIALHGPRSVGKSTILREFAAARDVEIIDLDNPAVRDAVERSPTGAVDGSAAPLCIDEYQYVPSVLDGIKARLNREGGRPGTAVLTGSTRHDALPRTAQALTGRLHTLVIWPLAQREIEQADGSFLAMLAENPEDLVGMHPASGTTRGEYVERLCAGGLPLAVGRSENSRNRWFDDYVQTSIERDAVELFRVRQRQVMTEVLNRLAGRTAQVLNLTTVGEGIGAARETVENHIRLLEDLYLVHRLPGWGKTLHTRSTAAPKIHVVDSGVAARLHRIGPKKLASLDPTVLTDFGHLLETFVVGELRAQASWMEEPHTVGHWRTSDGDEVDFVIEFEDGRVIAFEVKAGERVPGKDLAGLRKLRQAAGNRFIAGVALSTGPRSYTYEDRIHVMPIDRLWR